MKAYPSITTTIDFSKPYYIFDKLDGSNIRAEWNPKTGFDKFGSRTQLLVPEQTTLYPSIDAFKNKFADELHARFAKRKYERAVVFFEWVGPNSFAGSHPDPLDKMQVVPIDVAVFKKGILPPEKFLEVMEGLDHAPLLYRGKLDEERFQSVRTSTFPGMTFEGIIGKGEFSQKEGGPIMFKVKSNAWLTKLREMCNGDEALYQRLK